MARPHGTKYIETSEKMWNLFCAYKKEAKSNPFKVQDYVGKDGEMVYREKERPLTMEGFESFCYDNGVTVSNYFENKHDNYNDYYDICTRIRKKIREDQIEGGMASIYNPSITQRLNNLVEKQQIEVKETPPIFPDID